MSWWAQRLTPLRHFDESGRRGGPTTTTTASERPFEIPISGSTPWPRCPEAAIGRHFRGFSTRDAHTSAQTGAHFRLLAQAAAGGGRERTVLLVATFRVVEWAPPGEKNPLVVACRRFLLGPKERFRPGSGPIVADKAEGQGADKDDCNSRGRTAPL